MPRMKHLVFPLFLPLLLVAVGCSSAPIESTSGSRVTPDAGDAPPDGGDDRGRIGVPDAGSDSETASAPDATPPEDRPGTSPEPGGPLACEYRSNGYDGALLTLDAGPTSTERLVFVIEDVPNHAQLDTATLRFESYDADHPGEEGEIYVNGVGPFELPANAAWDNSPGTGALDVLGALVTGDNLIEFGSGDLSRSYFRIGRVSIEAQARVTECTAAPEPAPTPPPGTGAVERTIGYRDAVYTNRATWVVRCADYAFTAYSDEHLSSDCAGEYRAGGNRRGTASFQFRGVIPAEYEVWVRSRHTENRNRHGALFIVDGVERRISQRSDRDRTDDLWGTAILGGDVDVVLDSTRESESDSVISVTLRPAR